MPGLARKIFVDWQRKILLLSDQSGTPVDPPIFQKYETLAFEVVIVEPCAPWDYNSFQRIDITGISLTMALNNTLDDSSPLASQSTWVKDTTTNTFSGELSLNTAGMNSYIGSSSEITAYLELDLTEGASARTKVYTRSVTLKGSVLPPTNTAPDQIVEYLTRAQADGIYARWRGLAGQTLTLVSPDGTIQRVLGCNDDATGQDDYLTNT